MRENISRMSVRKPLALENSPSDVRLIQQISVDVSIKVYLEILDGQTKHQRRIKEQLYFRRDGHGIQ